MAKIQYFFFLLVILSCSAHLLDDLTEYESQCIGEDRLHCSDGTCIWKDQYCDGKVDCVDGSDENLCVDHTPAPDICNHTHHFLCADGKKCVPITWVCNNRSDCPDDSDEWNCSDMVVEDNNSTCKGFKCASDQKCISPFWACDGVYDCDDGSDEVIEVCRTHKGPERTVPFLYAENDTRCAQPPAFLSTQYSQYPCLDGAFCVNDKYMCNGMHDCKDGSDEGDFCRTWNVMCSSSICAEHSTCYPDRGGPKCYCDRNHYTYNYTAKACLPVNVCGEGRPECGQICKDLVPGNYLCDCEEGWLKDSMKLGVCVAPDPEAMLFFSTRNAIKYLTLKSKKIITVATGVKQPHGVNYDGEYVYWVETALGHQSIVRARLDNVAESKQVVVGVGLEDPGDISFDWLGGLIYFGDSERGFIAACTPNGTMCTRIKTNAQVPKFVTLSVRTGKIYWADWHMKPLIMVANMDGSDAKVLVDKLDSFPTGLALDIPSGRLYYVDGMIKGVIIDSGKRFVVMEPRVFSVYRPYSVAVFENLIYWSDWNFNTIQAMDKVRKEHYNSLIATLDSPVYGMHLYHPILNKAKSNPCADHRCSHFCLLKSNVSYTCACPDGMELIPPQNNTCREMINYRPQYLIVGGGANFTRVQYNLLGHPGTQMTYFDIGRVQAMAYDCLRDTLYIYDAQRRSINYVSMSNFSQGISRVLVYKGLVNVVDMDYDYITDCLYLADAGRRIIEVVSLRTKKRALVHRFEDEVPISLCVIPEYGKMMLAVSEVDEPTYIHIDTFNLDGYGRKHIFMNNLKGPHIRLKYSRFMDNVYLADEGNSIIDHLTPLGTNRETYRELSTSVTNLAVTELFVFWTDRRSSRLYWADIQDMSRIIRRIDLTIFPNTTHLHIQATNPAPAEIPDHPCQHNHCSHVCVQKNLPDEHKQSFSKTSLGYQCLCAPGFLLVGEVCKELKMCKDNESLCHGSDECIPMSSICDGKTDCQHGEDEDGCPNHVAPSSHPVCASDEVLCEDKCIHKNTICRTSTTTPAPITCSSSDYLCAADKFCIEHSQVCNGNTDCSDGSDESPALCATLSCPDTEFMCSVGNCIMASFRCDGEWDCDDGADEVDCENKICAQDYYRCNSGECIELKRRCDRHSDCIDNSDEEDCEETDVFDAKEEIENCEAWEHTCELNRSICIPFTARCNGIADCPGNTDEVDCGHICRNSGFRCKQEEICVSMSKVCDGVKDCRNGEDEWVDACGSVNKTSILYSIPIFPADECRDGYHCANGQCIEWANVCDGQPNCFDGTDENGLCATACNNNTCSHTCTNTPLGARCRCPVGYTIGKNKHKCIDDDECAREVCSQICHNTPGSFLCQCYKGYARRSDHRSCKSTKGNMSILYVTGNSVRSITAGGYITVEYNDSNAVLGRITDLDYDVRRQKLYVTSTETGTLVEVNNTHSEIIKNIGRPSRVALDWISGNVYFIDSTPAAMFLRVCNVMKKRCARLQKVVADSDVTALVVDPLYRRVFYCVTRDLESVLWSSTLAGTELTHIAVTHNCTGLAADSYKRRLYVAETGPAHIVTMNYEGNMFQRFLTEDPHLESPHDLAIFEDHIYFLVANSFKLNRCLLFGEKKCELYLQRVFNANSFVIRHENVQRDDITDSCKDFACDNVCVAGNSVPICLCDDGTISGSGKCPLVDKQELPLFNGWTYQDYQNHSFGVTLVSCIAALLAVYFGVFLYYHYVHKRRHQGRGYLPNFRVYFRNRRGSPDPADSLSPITDSAAENAPSSTQSSNVEFVNPMQMFRNFRNSFRKRPIGTAGLNVSVPPLDVSDTESDQDDRENFKKS